MSENVQMHSGSENLVLMETAIRYTKYVGRLVHKSLPIEGPIVEFGSGSGSQTQYVMPPQPRLTCVEINPELQAALRSRGYQAVGTLEELPSRSLAAVFSINCLEHVKDDESILKQIHECLKPGGTLVLYVPAMPTLFSAMDKLVGHQRRYRRRGLVELVRRTGFGEIDARYVDALGVVPSYLYKLNPRASGIPSKAGIKAYDTILFPLTRVVDKFTARLFGKNLFIVAVKA
jgi:SAM-dependent methyltransferase